MRTRVFFLLVLIIATSCTKKPGAAFTATAAEDNPLIFSFKNLSTDGERYLWNFGDGATSSEANPTHTYADTGVYSVVLTAENGNKFNSTTHTVEVKANDMPWKHFNSMSASFTKPDYDFVADSTVFYQDFANCYIKAYKEITGGKVIVVLTIPRPIQKKQYSISNGDAEISRWYKTMVTDYNDLSNGWVNIQKINGDTAWGTFSATHYSPNYGETSGQFQVLLQ